MLPMLVQVVAEAEAAAVSRQVVGITFTTGAVSAILPLRPEDHDLLPPPYEMQVLQQPQKRARRRTLSNFRVLTLHSPLTPADSQVSSEGAVPTLKLESAMSAGTSAPNSRPASSRHAEQAAADAAPAPAGAPAPTAPHTAAGKKTPRGKGSHAPAGAPGKPATVLEDSSPEVPAADK